MSIRDSEKEAEFLEMKSSTYPTSNSGESLTGANTSGLKNNVD